MLGWKLLFVISKDDFKFKPVWKPRIFTFYGLTLSRRTFSAVIVAASSKKPVMAPREIENEGQFKQLKILAL